MSVFELKNTREIMSPRVFIFFLESNVGQKYQISQSHIFPQLIIWLNAPKASFELNDLETFLEGVKISSDLLAHRLVGCPK